MGLVIVEDDVEVRTALRRSSESLFDDISEVSDANKAIKLIEKKRPCLVVCDWDLGGQLTGVDVATYVSQHGLPTKIVLITAKPLFKLQIATKHLKVDQYMAKPFSVAEYRSVLKQLIDQN